LISGKVLELRDIDPDKIKILPYRRIDLIDGICILFEY
jgi:hypothetical protein